VLPLGIVGIAFGPVSPQVAAAEAARLGFDHLDVSADADTDGLALPIGDRISGWELRAGYTCMAPMAKRTTWDEAVAALRAVPGCRIEPGPGTVCGSVEGTRALVSAVPGLRLTVDTAHVAAWGEDPIDLLDLADHVQLRQARRGRTQVHVDEGGDVDFAAVVHRLRRLGYAGRLSVEYFDLPDYGWPLEDPVGWSVALAAHVRPLLAG
jgi:sugar phosphate isomerase/epimerase